VTSTTTHSHTKQQQQQHPRSITSTDGVAARVGERVLDKHGRLRGVGAQLRHCVINGGAPDAAQDKVDLLPAALHVAAVAHALDALWRWGCH
jgi:hypothetical protein